MEQIPFKFSYFVRQGALYLFIFSLMLLLLFVIGNLQAFQEQTQIMLLQIIDKASLIFLLLSLLTLVLQILEAILYKTYPVVLFFITIVTILILGGIHFSLQFLTGFLQLQ